MEIKKLSPSDFALWNSYVEKHPMGTVFQTSIWLKNICLTPDIYIWRNTTQAIIGGIALVKTKQKGIIGYHYPPFTQYIFPLFGFEENSYQFNIKEYYLFISELSKELSKHSYVDLAFAPGHQNILPFHHNGFISEVLITHLIRDKSIKDWLARLNKNKIRELNKLLKDVESGNIVIHEDSKKEQIVFLLNTTSEKKSFSYNTSTLNNILKDDANSYVKTFVIESVELGFISAGVFVYDRNKVYNIINGSKTINHPIYKTINLLTLYKGIEFAFNHNLVFDFEGSMLSGVEEFYRLMGGEQHPVYRLYRSTSPYMLALKSLKLLHKQWKKN